MRLINLLLLSVILVVAGCVHHPDGTSPADFNGTWAPINEEMAGTVVPEGFFKDQRLIVLDSNYTVTADRVDKGVVKIAGNKMDIYSREGVNQGKHFTAIYKFENDLLKICYNLNGDSYPENFDTKGKALFFCSTFKRTAGN